MAQIEKGKSEETGESNIDRRKSLLNSMEKDFLQVLQEESPATIRELMGQGQEARTTRENLRQIVEANQNRVPAQKRVGLPGAYKATEALRKYVEGKDSND